MKCDRRALLLVCLFGALKFDATSLGAVTRGPYLQMNNASGVTLRWRTSTASDSVVWIGSSPGVPTGSTTSATVTTEHVVRVDGLQPDSTYYYAIGATGGQVAGGDATHFFHTAPSPGTDRATRLWILGDCGTSNANQRAVRDAYYSNPDYRFNDMVLLLGDNA